MVTRALHLIAGAVACGALAGCTLITDSFRSNDFSGDPYPIYVGRESGAVLIGLRKPGGEPLTAVLDVLSPVTITDPGIDGPQELVNSDLTLLGRSSPSDPEFDLARARLRAADVISSHPCAKDPENPVCQVGRPGMEHGYDALVGANVLAGDALRLRLGDAEAFILADIGGSEIDRTYVCDAVFLSPYRGGGTLVIAGTEVPFGGRRVTLQACLGAPAEPERETEGARGGDALLVMSTGIGISLLSEPAYERYRQAALLRISPPSPPPLPLDQLCDGSAYLPSGQVFGRLASIDRLALAAAVSAGGRAPCRQAYAHRYLLGRNCPPVGDPERSATDCPCTGTDTFCSVPAVVELAPSNGVEVLVVPDGDPTLQALRAELRPDQPEVDGILGADALQLAEIDVDYPHDRMLMRCTSAKPECVPRPALASDTYRTQVCNCIGPPDCVPPP